MKKFISILMAILMIVSVVPLTAFAEEAVTIVDSGTCGANGDNVTWTLDSNGTLTLSGEGRMANYSKSPWYSYRNVITQIIINNGVTFIGDTSFENCNKVTRAVIADSVTTIGCSAFAYCYDLNEVIFPKNLREIKILAFGNCTSLSSLEIPESVETIGNSAFEGCRSLKALYIPASVKQIVNSFTSCFNLESIVVDENNKYYDSRNNCNALIETKTNKLIQGCNNTIIPDGVSTIANHAFAWCQEFESIVLPDSVNRIEKTAFLGCTGLKSVTFGSGLNEICDQAFHACDNIESLSFPSSLQTIGKQAFYTCKGLKSVNFNEGLKTIAANAFAACFKLTEITIPDSVTEINAGAFSGCESLEKVDFGNGVKSIGAHVFFNCSNLSSVYIPASVERIDGAITAVSGIERIEVDENNPYYDSRNNCNAIIETATDKLVSGCNGTVIPESITAIGDDAFYGCDGLETVNMSDGLMEIGANAFCFCSGIKSVTIPDSVTVIGESAFDGCDNLEKVTLPGTITEIKRNTFSRCPKLKDINIPESVKEIGASAFRYCRSIKEIVIPEGITIINEDTFGECTGLESVVIPDSVNEIAAAAFHRCSSLTEINIPESVTSIGRSAFAYCRSLESVVIPSDITAIEENEFYYCDTLSSISIPKNVESIGEFAFGNTTNLESIIIPKSVKNIAAYAFYNSTLKTVFYEGCEDDWKEIAIDERNDPLVNAKIYYNFCIDGHKNVTTEAGIPATCTEPGISEGQVCNDCGYVIKAKEEIPAAGHSWAEAETVKAPTCTEPGEVRKTCVNCGACENSTVTAAGHSWSKKEVIKSATCTEDGEERKTCSSCGKYESFVIPATGHTISTIEYVENTCTEDGYYVNACINCGGERTERILNAHHDYDWENTVTVQNTCTEDGYCEISCKKCDKKIKNILYAQHDYDWENAVTVQNTCTEDGYYEIICKRCGEQTRNVLYAQHDYDWDNAVEVPATCTKNGYFDVDCKVCGEHYHGIYYASHSYDEMTVIKEATCAEDGSYTRTCKVCGYVDNGRIPALDHIKTNVIVIKEPTCETYGEYTYTCSRCGFEGSATTIAKGHTFNPEDCKRDTPCTDETETYATCTVCGKNALYSIGHRGTFIERKEGTCIKKGEYVYRCQICDEIYSEYTSYALHSDKDNDMLCDVCGKEFFEIGVNEKKSFTVKPDESVYVKFTPEKDSKYLFNIYSLGYESFSLYNPYSNWYDNCYDIRYGNTYFPDSSNLTYSDVLVKDSAYYIVLSLNEWERSDLEVYVSVTEYADCTDGGKHHFSEFIPDNNATCSEYGTETMTCTVCGYSISQTDRDSALSHDYKVSFTEPTATSKGCKTYTCRTCGYSYSHAYANGYAVGDKIQYGNYPQSQETDPEILKQLDAADKNWVSFNYYALSDDMIDEIINGADIDYPLATESDYMKYADIDIDGDGTKDYRAVISSAYRYYNASYTIENPDQYRETMGEEDFNKYIEYCKEWSGGYEINTVYYFKYEPVSWIVLDPEEGLVLSEAILDSQAYNNCLVLSATGDEDDYRYEAWGDPEKTIIANDYSNSSIRSWLNNEFYNTAFTSDQKANIAVSELNNDCVSPYYAKWWFGDTLVDHDEYVKRYVDNETLFFDEKTGTVIVKNEKNSFNSTNDKMFILSALEVTNGNYGFEKDIYGACDYYCEYPYGGIDIYDNSSRIAEPTDYSVLHGGEFYSTCWGLRTASAFDEFGRMCVFNNGAFMPENYQGAFSTLTDTYLGVRPAMRLNELKNDTEKSVIPGTCEHEIYENEYIAPTCTENGYIGGKVCINCEMVFETPEIIPPTGHSAEPVEAISPTCTENGRAAGTVCGSCGEILSGLDVIPATGHSDPDSDGICNLCDEEIGSGENNNDDTFVGRIMKRIASLIDRIVALFRRLFK